MEDVLRRLMEIEKSIYGNGDKGLKLRMNNAEISIESLVKIHENAEQDRKWLKRWVMGIAAVVISAGSVAAFGSVYQALKVSATNSIVERAARQVNEAASEMRDAAATVE